MPGEYGNESVERGQVAGLLNHSILRIAACVLSLLAGSDLRAYSEVRFEHLSLEHGLAQSAVQDMVSDDLGYMWFGTQYGLSRYDGYGFRNFRQEPENPASLSNSRIQRLLRASNGSLWIGTRAGLNRLDPKTLTIERMTLSEWPDGSGQARQPHVSDLAEDKAGNIVVQTRRGLLFYERSSGRMRPLPFEEPVSRDAVGSLQSDHQGRVWLFNRHGLWRFDADGPALRRVLEHAIDERHARQSSLTVLASGELALAGSKGVLVFDPDRDRIVRRILPTAYGNGDDLVPALAADPRGYLWLLTRNTLVQYDYKNDAWREHLVRW